MELLAKFFATLVVFLLAHEGIKFVMLLLILEAVLVQRAIIGLIHIKQGINLGNKKSPEPNEFTRCDVLDEEDGDVILLEEIKGFCQPSDFVRPDVFNRSEHRCQVVAILRCPKVIIGMKEVKFGHLLPVKG